jgi:hypothetical protein
MLQGLLDARWPSHCLAIASAVSSLQLVTQCQDARTVQRFFATLSEASDKTGPQQHASLVILASAIEQTSDEQLTTTGERLPGRLVALIKAPATTVEMRLAAVECATALLRRLGRAATTRKLAASLVGSLIPVLQSAMRNVLLVRACCECLAQGCESAGPTVAPKAQAVRGAALEAVWSNAAPAAVEVVGAHLAARVVLTERGEHAWSAAFAAVMHGLSVLASRAAPEVVGEIAVGDDAWLPPVGGRDACRDYGKLCRVAEELLQTAEGHLVTLPTHVAVEHFYRVLRTDPAAQLNNTLSLSALLRIKERALQLLGVYFAVARSASLLHHARWMEMLQGSFAWARSHADATLAAVAACYASYVRHVPAGHMERPVFQALVTVEHWEVVGPHLALLIECRAGLWQQLAPSTRVALQHRLVSELAAGDTNAVSVAARAVNAVAVVDLPSLVSSVGGSGHGPHLASLSLRLRPPAPLWPLAHTYESEKQQQQQHHATNVFVESGLIDSSASLKRKPDPVVPVVAADTAEKKSRVAHRVEEQASGAEMDYSSFQPQLQQNVHTATNEEGEDAAEGDEDEDVEPMPMIVDASPSNSEE